MTFRGKEYEWPIFIGAFVIALALGLILTAALVWIVCWAFGIEFSWRLAVGVYAVIVLIRMAVVWRKR